MMRVMQLPRFGLDNLQIVHAADPVPGVGEVLVKFGAASINYRDYQIVIGEFAPTQALPIVPCSDGAGEVVATGDGVTRFATGDKVAPLFFPNWISGPAYGDERGVSSGLEAPGVLREFGVYKENQLAALAPHLTVEEGACFPCAGVTAWNSLVDCSCIGPGDWVLVQGTGGVAIAALQFAKALGASVIVTSSHDEKLDRAKQLGADHGINYVRTPDWGDAAMAITGGRGVDAILEIGGTGTLQQSVAALRRGGHINIIGYLAGVDLGLTVYDLIMKNAHLHGISVGNRDTFEGMMHFVAKQRIRPVIDRAYVFEEAADAFSDIARGQHLGKLIVTIQ
jgi:NADPH:quinone reductase-like Zn-dependent oxidoreductase